MNGSQPEPTAPRRARVDLPPEEPSLLRRNTDEETAVIRSQLKRRNSTAIAIVLLLVLGGVGAGVYQYLSTRRTGPPIEAVTQRDGALHLLRRADERAMAEALTIAEKLTATYPTYFEGKAVMVAARALDLDETKTELRYLELQARDLQKRIDLLKEAQSPSDWHNRVNTLIDQLAEVQVAHEPLLATATDKSEKLRVAYRAMGLVPKEASSDELVAGAMANGLYHAVNGSAPALEEAERYRIRRNNQDDGWGAIIEAIYALNAEPPVPATQSDAREGVEALTREDNTFRRAYFLAARLAFAQKQYEQARGSLDALMLLEGERKPVLVTKLAAWVQEEERQQQAPTPSVPEE